MTARMVVTQKCVFSLAATPTEVVFQTEFLRLSSQTAEEASMSRMQEANGAACVIHGGLTSSRVITSGGSVQKLVLGRKHGPGTSVREF